MIRNFALVGYAFATVALMIWLALALGVHAMTDFDCGDACAPGVWDQFWIGTLLPIVVWLGAGVIVYRKWIR